MSKPKSEPVGRLSRASSLVLGLLGKNAKLFSAQEIYFWLKQNEAEAPALTTVYRSIDTLLKHNLIQAVDIGDGEKRYERVAPGEHHHHLICTNCLSSIHLDFCYLSTLAESIESRHSFKVRSHVLEIFGLCKACSEMERLALIR